MVMDHEIIIFTPIFAVLIGFIVFRILKKRKRSAKSIYKLIDDLEKKYIYWFFFVKNQSNSIPTSSFKSLSKSGRWGSTQCSLLSIPAAFT